MIISASLAQSRSCRGARAAYDSRSEGSTFARFRMQSILDDAIRRSGKSKDNDVKGETHMRSVYIFLSKTRTMMFNGSAVSYAAVNS